MSPLAAFLTADGRDHAGRSYADILAMSDAELERHHDFIQWIFPLPEPSRAAPGAQVLSVADIAAAKASGVALARLTAGAARMSAFYRQQSAWLAPYDHNHLRITRIIRSLRLLVGDAAADDFRARILVLAEGAPISPEARKFWAAA